MTLKACDTKQKILMTGIMMGAAIPDEQAEAMMDAMTEEDSAYLLNLAGKYQGRIQRAFREMGLEAPKE